ncbi:MAG: hypothetical protein DI536_33800 [Archangium gephyra]|uniref:Uncharacterized protein n=1 Tax=Archangium gephyra TaxID=48 RepID=A0A2W5V419_9BACT|nr:MAG: hypothetical protein DI536_33800 [Archangium gephyra]
MAQFQSGGITVFGPNDELHVDALIDSARDRFGNVAIAIEIHVGAHKSEMRLRLRDQSEDARADFVIAHHFCLTAPER